MQNTFPILQQKDQELFCNTYARYPLAVHHGKGTRLFDFENKEYLDLLAGISVCNLGHCHPELIQTIKEQSEKLIHVSNLFYQEEQIRLAEKILATTHLDRVFFSNSGAEANEAAIKLARRYMQKVKKREAYEIITLEGSFHGRTLATLTATGQEKFKDGFYPLPLGFISVPINDLESLSKAVKEKTAGIMLEVIQGEGGIRPLSENYLVQVQQLCRDKGILFIIDEVQTGMARTGKFWAHQHLNLKPDIFTAAKALANGLPMGAMCVSQEVSQGFDPGSHAATFGGGPLVSSVAEKVIDIIHRDKLCSQAEESGNYAFNLFNQLKNMYPNIIQEVRGNGLMLGIECKIGGQEIWQNLLDQGYICNLIQGKVLRLLPALIISKKELSGFSQALEKILQSFSNK